jgi:hypothetical protein
VSCESSSSSTRRTLMPRRVLIMLALILKGSPVNAS